MINPPVTLVEACQRNDIAAVRRFLERGADARAPDEDGEFPLDAASAWGYTALVQLLLDHGADPNQPDSFGESALQGAARGRFADTVAVLLAAGAEIDYAGTGDSPTSLECVVCRGATALHLAVRRRSEGTAAVLLASGAAVDARDPDGCTPLDWLDLRAAVPEEAPLRRLLLAYGARRGPDCMARYLTGEAAPTADNLLYAVVKGHRPSVRALLAAGAPPDARDENGTPALALAAGTGDTSTVRTLLRAGADVEGRNGDPLWDAAYHGHAHVVSELLAAGASPRGWAVVTAARRGHAAVLRRLLAAGGDPNARGWDDLSALEAAVHPDEEWSHGHPSTVRGLLDAGAELNERTGSTAEEALARAAEVDLSGYTVAHELREWPDLDRLDDDGYTPLMWAARYGVLATVQLLLDLGVDAESTDPFGRTAEDLAREAGHAEIAALIRSAIERES